MAPCRPVLSTVFLTLLVVSCALVAMPTARAQTPDVVVFGPKQYLRTSGAPNTYTDTVTVTVPVGAPFLLHIVNGNADGTNRVSSARVTLNGGDIAGPSDFSQTVAVIDRPVTLLATNILEVRLTSAPGSFLTISLLGTKVTPTGLTPNPLILNAGSAGSLTADHYEHHPEQRTSG